MECRVWWSCVALIVLLISHEGDARTALCSLKMDVGTCRASHRSWYYNTDEKECKPFYYGGCGGNANKFIVQKDCERLCMATCENDFKVQTGTLSYSGIQVHSANTLDKCKEDCSSREDCLFFDFDKNYSTCFRHTSSHTVAENVNANGVDQYVKCAQSAPAAADSSCRETFTKTAGALSYGGTEVDGADTADKCLDVCRARQDCPFVDFDSNLKKCFRHMVYNIPTQNKNANGVDQYKKVYCGVCTQPRDSGPCRALIWSWYYNVAEKECTKFPYGGCQGNDNRFDSQDACEQKCSGTSAPPPAPNPVPQKVHCSVSKWSAWGTCSVTCGHGRQTRQRTIERQPANGGDACPNLQQSSDCIRDPCATQSPAVNCAVSSWGAWSTCSVTCGTGRKERRRSVTQTNSGGGDECPHLSHSAQCNAGLCPMSDPAPEPMLQKVHCSVSKWAAWGPCSVTCGNGRQTRQRTIVRQPANGGDACPNLTQSSDCIRDPCATSAPPPAPKPVPQKVHCSVSKWSAWGTCSVTCGYGRQTRQRTVVRQPANGGDACPNLTQSSDCIRDPCAPVAVDCRVSGWSRWSDCNEDCGAGLKSRQRQVTQGPQNGGTTCPTIYETEGCTGTSCDHEKVDCEVSRWGRWSSCEPSCGDDRKRTRTRTVVQEPQNGGRSCGSLEKTRKCRSKKCKVEEPVDCKLSRWWSRWSSCIGNCGIGYRFKTRKIARQAANGGKECPTKTRKKKCHLQPCTQ